MNRHTIEIIKDFSQTPIRRLRQLTSKQIERMSLMQIHNLVNEAYWYTLVHGGDLPFGTETALHQVLKRRVALVAHIDDLSESFIRDYKMCLDLHQLGYAKPAVFQVACNMQIVYMIFEDRVQSKMRDKCPRIVSSDDFWTFLLKFREPISERFALLVNGLRGHVSVTPEFTRQTGKSIAALRKQHVPVIVGKIPQSTENLIFFSDHIISIRR